MPRRHAGLGKEPGSTVRASPRPRGSQWFYHCLHVSFAVSVCTARRFAVMGWGQGQDFPGSARETTS